MVVKAIHAGLVPQVGIHPRTIRRRPVDCRVDGDGFVPVDIPTIPDGFPPLRHRRPGPPIVLVEVRQETHIISRAARAPTWSVWGACSGKSTSPASNGREECTRASARSAGQILDARKASSSPKPPEPGQSRRAAWRSTEPFKPNIPPMIGLRWRGLSFITTLRPPARPVLPRPAVLLGLGPRPTPRPCPGSLPPPDRGGPAGHHQWRWQPAPRPDPRFRRGAGNRTSGPVARNRGGCPERRHRQKPLGQANGSRKSRR